MRIGFIAILWTNHISKLAHSPSCHGNSLTELGLDEWMGGRTNARNIYPYTADICSYNHNTLNLLITRLHKSA